MTECPQKKQIELNFLEESKLDPSQAFHNNNRNILADLSPSQSHSPNSGVFMFAQSDQREDESNSPKFKTTRFMVSDSESETVSKKNTFGQSMKGFSQELKNLRPLKRDKLRDQRVSNKKAGIPRIERASTLGPGSKRRNWAGQLTLKYVDNPSIGILDLSNRSRSFGRMRNRMDSPIQEERHSKQSKDYDSDFWIDWLVVRRCLKLLEKILTDNFENREVLI